ncbi:WD repeat domain-containing protein [Xylogone sp. PMI_703]|nr:WD repeat domain-containing protein [Xylogone sp. PMI_703]
MSLSPAQPTYILRGHAAQIHSTEFIRSNSRLVTGDSEGWVVIWSLEIKRPVAVWKAHEGAILGADAWGKDKLITHGKDNKLIVWKYSEEDEPSLSIILPVDHAAEPRTQPWLLHILEVNTMNFCSFAKCESKPTGSEEVGQELLIAVPNTMGSETVDIFYLPSCERRHTVPAPKPIKGGMVMTVALTYRLTDHSLTVITGYESGHTAVTSLTSKGWQTTYVSEAHTQPVLSLSVSPEQDYYLTSSADANIVKHPIPPPALAGTTHHIESSPIKTIQTKHSGQQGLKIRNDGKIFATAGWDSKIRVYSCKGMKELAVLKWHKEGCYAVAFANVGDETETEENIRDSDQGGSLVHRLGKLTVKEERIKTAKRAHWLAAGSKDGKISLWIIY